MNFNPPVWRRLRVNGDCTLRKLHHFIQAAFGWHSSHLHEFSGGIHRYLPLDAELMYMYDDALDDRKSKLRHVLKEADRLRYLYDFGDSWQHVIAVESIEPCDFTGTWCEVLDGARACPPEDVGGTCTSWLQAAALIPSCLTDAPPTQRCSGSAITSGAEASAAKTR